MNAMTRVMTSDLGLGRGAKIRATATGARRPLVDIMIRGLIYLAIVAVLAVLVVVIVVAVERHFSYQKALYLSISEAAWLTWDVCQWASCPADIQSTHAASRRAPQWGIPSLASCAQLTILVKGARRQRDSRSERHEFLSRLAVCGRTTLLLPVIVAAAGQGLRGGRRNAPNQRRRCTYHAASSSRHPLCLQANRAWKLDWTRRRGLRMILQIGCSRIGWTKTTERLTCCTRGRPRGPPNLRCRCAILAMTVP
jgi:hypothetical protein